MRRPTAGRFSRRCSTCGPISGRPTVPILKARVLFATVLIFVAKLATIAVPFTFKWATDALAGHGTAPIGPNDWLAWAVATPIMMTIAYGGMRILMALLTQWRDGDFRQGGDERGAAPWRFSPSSTCICSRCAFIWSARPAASPRVLERGRNGIETIVRMRCSASCRPSSKSCWSAPSCCCSFDWRYLLVSLADRRALYLVHLRRHPLAHRLPPRDERKRHRRQHQGGRQSAQFRDGQIFQQREA